MAVAVGNSTTKVPSRWVPAIMHASSKPVAARICSSAVYRPAHVAVFVTHMSHKYPTPSRLAAMPEGALESFDLTNSDMAPTHPHTHVCHHAGQKRIHVGALTTTDAVLCT